MLNEYTIVQTSTYLIMGETLEMALRVQIGVERHLMFNPRPLGGGRICPLQDIHAGASFCIGLVGPKPYQCSVEPYQYSSEPYQSWVSFCIGLVGPEPYQ